MIARGLLYTGVAVGVLACSDGATTTASSAASAVKSSSASAASAPASSSSAAAPSASVSVAAPGGAESLDDLGKAVVDAANKKDKEAFRRLFATVAMLEEYAACEGGKHFGDVVLETEKSSSNVDVQIDKLLKDWTQGKYVEMHTKDKETLIGNAGGQLMECKVKKPLEIRHAEIEIKLLAASAYQYLTVVKLERWYLVALSH